MINKKIQAAVAAVELAKEELEKIVFEAIDTQARKEKLDEITWY